MNINKKKVLAEPKSRDSYQINEAKPIKDSIGLCGASKLDFTCDQIGKRKTCNT